VLAARRPDATGFQPECVSAGGAHLCSVLRNSLKRASQCPRRAPPVEPVLPFAELVVFVNSLGTLMESSRISAFELPLDRFGPGVLQC
jgi:hypothetical protein